MHAIRRETWCGASVCVENVGKFSLQWFGRFERKYWKLQLDPNLARSRIAEIFLSLCPGASLRLSLAPCLPASLGLVCLPTSLFLCYYYALVASVWWIWAVRGLGSGHLAAWWCSRRALWMCRAHIGEASSTLGPRVFKCNLRQWFVCKNSCTF